MHVRFRLVLEPGPIHSLMNSVHDVTQCKPTACGWGVSEPSLALRLYVKCIASYWSSTNIYISEIMHQISHTSPPRLLSYVQKVCMLLFHLHKPSRALRSLERCKLGCCVSAIAPRVQLGVALWRFLFISSSFMVNTTVTFTPKALWGSANGFS